MIFHWFNASEAEKTASELADQFAAQPANGSPDGAEPERESTVSLQELLRRADSDPRLTGLNFFKKARFANSFKWRLLENGIAPLTANRVTHSLIVHLSRRSSALGGRAAPGEDVTPPPSGNDSDLLRRGNKAFASGAYKEALRIYRRLAGGDSANPEVMNGLGATLCQTGEFIEAEQQFRQALALAPDYIEASYNLGNVLRWTGNLDESEIWLRRTLKANPKHLEARSSLGLTLTFLGRPREAKTRFEKVLKTAPRNAEALFGMGLIAKASGQFSEAEALFKQALEYRPKMAAAWAEVATLRPMTSADSDWLRSVKALLKGGVSRLEEADLLFAIGKYYDDIGEFDEAFPSFRAANEILKEVAIKYNRKGRDGFIDDMLRLYTQDAIAAIGEVGSESTKPVFVVGMPRSGTSLTGQILASHPSVFGAGEIDFWNTFTRTHESEVREGLLNPAMRKKLAEDYLRLLESRGGGMRVIDKTTINSDYLGIIYSVLPNARFIYMERDPMDTCLSCYFQQFFAGLSFCLDLSDLAHYYTGHRRLMKHWQSVLPAENLLVVPYEGLVADQEGWTRKMLGFLGLDWNERCLSFHQTQRLVTTASARQVRQKISSDSVGRSRAYKKFLAPLKALKT